MSAPVAVLRQVTDRRRVWFASSETDAEEWRQCYALTVQNMAGRSVDYSSFSAASLVRELALAVRADFGVPLCSMNLLHGDQLLTDLSLTLGTIFGETSSVDLLLVRRSLTEEEQANLDAQLLRNVAAGASREVQECMAEGAQVKHGIHPGVCDMGAITPLMMAIAVGNQEIQSMLREHGAEEPNMTPLYGDLPAAFRAEDLVDIVRLVAAGKNVNVTLRRGEGVRATSSGTPLHACCAMHKLPGSTEVAQLLVTKKADLTAGDAEGDTPLAHAKYFGAEQLFEVLESNGAEIGGPFYRMREGCFGRR